MFATGDKGGRVVIFQRDPAVSIGFTDLRIISFKNYVRSLMFIILHLQSKDSVPKRGEYNVYSTFQSHEPEFDYLKSLEIEEKINKIRWLKRKNPAHFLLSTNGKAVISMLNLGIVYYVSFNAFFPQIKPSNYGEYQREIKKWRVII